jgi:hypothetical protein
MPILYPPAAPTLSGDNLTVSRFLNSPQLVQRTLRTLAQQRFIADSVLQGRPGTSGGAVLVETSETIFAQGTPEAIEPGGEFPLSLVNTGIGQLLAVTKWGLDTVVTDEAIERQNFDPVMRAITKLVNSIVKQVDSVAMSAINTAVTQTSAAAGLWSTSTTLVREIAAAVAGIVDLNQGYDPDTVVVSRTAGAYLTANDKVLSLLPRERDNVTSGPVYTGVLNRLMNLDIMTTPNLPVNTLALVLDRKVLGGMAEEVPLTSRSIRQEENERWRLRAKRVVVPFIQEPNAAWKITGVA